jgi:hypothetical protein
MGEVSGKDVLEVPIAVSCILWDMQSGESQLTFQRNISPPFSGPK